MPSGPAADAAVETADAPAAEASAADEARGRFENDLFLRLADVEEAIAIIDHLFAEFCRERGSTRWAGRTLAALQAWVDELR